MFITDGLRRIFRLMGRFGCLRSRTSSLSGWRFTGENCANRRLRRRDSSNYSELFAAQVAGSTGLLRASHNRKLMFFFGRLL